MQCILVLPADHEERRSTETLAADLTTMWQSELAALATDREHGEQLGRMLAPWLAAEAARAGTAGEPVGPERRSSDVAWPSPGPMRRRGPRPLPLHLLIARAASDAPDDRSRPAAEGSEMPQVAPVAEPLTLDRAFIAGIAAYRRHPWSRDLPEPDIVWREGGSRLLDFGGTGRIVVFVPSLINRAHILDLTRQRSLMRWLAGRGVRPLLLDWGWPGEAERRFTLTDYVAGRLERAVCSLPQPAVLAGYCMGGLLAVAAAQRRPERVEGLALLATPWDFHAADGELARSLAAALPGLEPILVATGTLPVDVLQGLFASLGGAAVATRYRGFARVDPGSDRARQFVALEDWLNDGVPLAAPVARECLAGWYGANAPARGTWRIAGDTVRPEALRCATLVVLPSRDRIVPPPSAKALAERMVGAEILQVPGGHVGMIVGADAEPGLWTPLLRWLHER